MTTSTDKSAYFSSQSTPTHPSSRHGPTSSQPRRATQSSKVTKRTPTLPRKPLASSSTMKKVASSSAMTSTSKKTPRPKTLTPHQRRVYTHLLSIPAGRLTTYGTLSAILNSSPRAVGQALRTNPYAPHVPCHRVISKGGYVGGFKGDWEDAPSGVNQSQKLRLLREEGLRFDGKGNLVGSGVLMGWEEEGKERPGDEELKRAEKELESIEGGFRKGELVAS